jgi:hypothetical protein
MTALPNSMAQFLSNESFSMRRLPGPG